MSCANCEDCAVANADPKSRPIVYEIHVTVAPANVSDFKLVCHALGVKPILLELQRENKESLTDMMTSSVVHHPDFEIAMGIAHGTANDLRSHGFSPIRIKIETVPWHPTARLMPWPCQYFESHFAILFPAPQGPIDELKNVYGLHFSRNAFKKNDDGTWIQMATYRTKDRLEDFERVCDNIVATMDAYKIRYEKVIKEFAIFDTKLDHDDAWMAANTIITDEQTEI